MPYCSYTDFELSSAGWKGPRCCLDNTPHSSKSQGIRGSSKCDFQKQAGVGDKRSPHYQGCNEHLGSSWVQLCQAVPWLWLSVTHAGDPWAGPELLSPPAPFSEPCSAPHQAAADLLWVIACHRKVNQKQDCWQQGLCGSGLSVIPLMLNLEWWCSDGFQWEHISAKAETIAVWHEVFVGS